ncbi:MAG: glycosyltransferase [Rhodoglobus sp.]
MASILVTVMPFAGHAAPVSGVVAELVHRGHDVAVYTGARYLDRFEKLGARAIPWSAAPDFDEHNLPATFPQVGKRGAVGLLANLEHIFIRTGSGQATDMVAAHAVTPFDLIVGDVMSVGTGLAAELLELPWATLSIVPLSLPSVDMPPSGLALQPGFGAVGTVRDAVLRGVFRVASAPLDRAYRQVRAELGLPKTHARFADVLYSPWLVAATGTPSLEYPRSDLGSQFHFVGRLAAASPASTEHPDWWPDLAAAATPVVLVTQGTFNIDPGDLLEPALRGLADSGALVLGTTAGASLTEIPGNARVAPYLPFADVLPLVDVAITNGGWGGVLETLSYGVPLIVAGGDLDKPEIAARVGWSGAGVDLGTGHPSDRAVARAYRRVKDTPGFSEKARAIAAELETLGGASTLADLVEGLLATGEPVRRASNPWG